jgi:hypothetical protein
VSAASHIDLYTWHCYSTVTLHVQRHPSHLVAQYSTTLKASSAKRVPRIITMIPQKFPSPPNSTKQDVDNTCERENEALLMGQRGEGENSACCAKRGFLIGEAYAHGLGCRGCGRDSLGRIDWRNGQMLDLGQGRHGF